MDLNGRVYDPTVGRFISADLTVPYWQNSEAFNRYSYAYNDPLLWIDPSGYDPNSALVGAGAIDTVFGVAEIGASGGLLYLTGESGGNYNLGAAALVVGVAGAYETGVGGLEIYQGLEGYSQPEIPTLMSQAATGTGLVASPADTIGQEFVKQILLWKQNEINNAVHKWIQYLNNLLHRQSPPQSKPAPPSTSNLGIPGNGPPNNNNDGLSDICSQVTCQNPDDLIPIVTIKPVSCMKETKNGKVSTCPT